MAPGSASPAAPRPLIRVAALAAAVALSAAPVLGPPWGAVISVVLLPMAVAAHLRGAVAVRNAALAGTLVALTVLLPKGGWGWPAPALLVLLVAVAPTLRGEGGLAAWFHRGTLGAGDVAWAGAIALLSGAALVAWFAAARPDLSDLTGALQRMPVAAVICGGALWAAFNAFGEESIFRGALTEGLEAALGSRAALAIQAVAFGAAHWSGVPRGVAGVLLATVYGIMLGLLRRRARGLLAPMLAHLFADLVVLAILIAWK